MSAPSSLAMPAGADDEARGRALRRMRGVASGLLALAAVVYALTLDRDGAWGFVNAAAEASMVGAIADWFAVTAIFRHPLGLPVPHTALIPRRKATLAASLEEFVGQNFLNAPVVRDRIARADVPTRLATWAADPVHAARAVEEVSKVARDGLARVRPEDVDSLVTTVLLPRLRSEELSPLAGELLAQVVDDRAHRGLVDLALGELARWLEGNSDVVARIMSDRAPWWTPQWLDDRVIARLQVEITKWVADIRDDPEHQVRGAIDRLLVDLAEDLQHDASVRARAERLKERVLEQAAVRTTVLALWDATRQALDAALADPDGMLRTRAREELVAFAERVRDDEAARERYTEMLTEAAGYVVVRYGEEIATVISDTIERWDAKETSERIELYVGRDLQFIRINGTVVGGLVGILIHTVTVLV